MTKKSPLKKNDPCPCGSGNKYRDCCFDKPNNKFEHWKANAEIILSGYQRKDDLIKVFFNTLDYVDKNDWGGACHATSAVLYVLLSELGFEPILCVGEAKYEQGFFDHSWIEIDGRVFDVAVYLSMEFSKVSPPVINGYNIDTLQPSNIEYGVSGYGLDRDANRLFQVSFNQYMNDFPNFPGGLWGVVNHLALKMSLKFNIPQLKRKYTHTQWTKK